MFRRYNDAAGARCVSSNHQRETTNHFRRRAAPWQVSPLPSNANVVVAGVCVFVCLCVCQAMHSCTFFDVTVGMSGDRIVNITVL